MRSFFLLFSSFLFCICVIAQDDLSTCSITRPCYQGCCSASGNCGFGPSYCGTGCQSNCDAKAECGKYAPSDRKDCPINVCCSQYGFCGTTSEFCGTGCQKNSKGDGCGEAKRPGCGQNTDAMSYKRRIGYYELFNLHERLCDKVYPEDLEVSPLTHINLAFVLFDSSFKMIDEDGELISRVSFLKSRYRGLRVNVAIGGWAFNDPPTQTRFSDMASTEVNRQVFIGSLVSFLRKYGLDGVDIDWEYPAATDRGGIKADTDNYVLLMSEIQEAFARENPGWEATITIPTSYWYLRGFDVTRLQKYVSWFNVMSYDLHGMWDKHNQFTGPYLEGHTNVSEIDLGLDLLWRNDILPANVVMGFAFYGRSFTMSDSTCSKPGCTFSTSGNPGSCTNTGGILSYSEVSSRNFSLSTQTYYDPKSTVKWNVYDGNQWVSYDDQQSFFDKKKFLSGRCLSGLMIWAIDQDTQNHDALEGLLGDFSSSQLEGGGLDDKTAGALSDAFGAYTGQNCFVTPTCTDGTDSQKQDGQICPSGTTSVSTAHSPLQASGHELFGVCDEGWYRHICCPTKSMPKNCKWNGAPIRSAFGCTGKCGDNQFLLNTDDYLDDKGKGSCFTGTRDLCCDSTEIIDDCFWTDCQGPLDPSTTASCGTGDFEYQTYRFDQDNGDWCSSAYVSSVDGSIGSPLHDRFKRAFCCPKGKGFRQCNWSNDPKAQNQPNGILQYDPDLYCKPQPCAKTQTQVTQALEPPEPPEVNPTHTGINCDGVSTPPGYDQDYPYCCDPPSTYSDKWPVDPKYLFEHYYDGPEDDVMWSYDDEFRNNNADTSQSAPGDESGKDAYGFVMLDGAPGSLDNDFPATHTITRRTAKLPNVKRSILTTNSTIIDSTFDHSEETVYIFCNYPQDSPECQKIWYKGAEDTIIRLPNHVGEGPYARVVSMELAEPEYKLPQHHIQARSTEGNSNAVYKMKFDYDFHLIKRADVVNMRVDFTNLLGYWDDLTDEPASKKMKRKTNAEHLSNEEWRSKIGKAKLKHEQLRKRKVTDDGVTTTTDMSQQENTFSKRWFGTFLNWLGRLNTVESKNLGFLSMAFQKSILLFKATAGCPGQTFSANMKMYLDANVEMEATYAYYFSGTVVPPAVTGTYAYFSLEPSAYLGLRLVGNARFQAGTERKKLLDTISYPGLAIKGLAAVGPTLDLYGQIRGVITLKGEMKAGAKVNFGKAEVFWPQDDKAGDKYQKLLGITAAPKTQGQDLIEPTFDAKVKIDAQIDILVTPEANMGLKIGGKISGGTPLVDAQLVGYVNTSLSFQASATGSLGSDSAASLVYRYGVYLYYNIGYGAHATIKFFPNWALAPRNAYNPSPRFTIYEKTGSFSGATPNSKRTIDATEVLQLPRRGLLGNRDGVKLTSIDGVEHVIGDRYTDSTHQNISSSMDKEFILARRADVDGGSLPDAQTPDFSQPLTCPPGATAQLKLPDFRLNCGIFGDSQLNNPTNGAFRSVSGICTGIQTYFNGQSLANSDQVLTWDPFKKRTNTRRAAACGSQYCLPAQNVLQAAIGGPKIDLSCDEYPFAGTEEGGNYLNPQLTCVPAWQNTLQGNCNKILSQLQTNVAYFERQTRGDEAENFVTWSTGSEDNTWTTRGSFGQLTPQRLALYPNRIPQSAGISDNEYASNGNQISYMYKRNFTFGLASPANHDDGAAWALTGGPATKWTLAQSNNQPGGEFPVGTDGGDLTAIACAVNTFGQDDIFHAPYNALCYNGGNIRSGRGFPTPESFSYCIVEFGTGATKRSLGTFNGWHVTSIKMKDDPVVEIPKEDFSVPFPEPKS